MKLILVFVLALSSAVTADPAVLLSGLLPTPLTSAALVAPASAPLVTQFAPASAPLVTQFAPASAPLVTQFAPLSSLPAFSPLASYSVGPVLSDYRYSYSSSYQDYFSGPVVNSALTALPQALSYSLPYAYSADWFFRK